MVIKMFVVVPLLLVDLKGTASTAMETEYKTVSVGGFLAMNKIIEPHFESIELMVDDFFFENFAGRLKLMNFSILKDL